MEIEQMIKDSGLKQTYLAKKMGVTRQYLNQMIKGTRYMDEKYKIEIRRLCMKQLA